MTKKYFNGSYGYIGYVEKLDMNMAFASEKEYLEFINDDDQIEETRDFVDFIKNGGYENLEVGRF